MTIDFEKAKDGNTTCKIDGFYLHSAYSPIKEAGRFASSVKATFAPEIVFVIEPGLSYCADFLRERFENRPLLAAIRLCDAFKESNHKFDIVINYFDCPSPSDFENNLFNSFGEEKLSYSVFQLWEPSGKIFKKETAEVFASIKNAINKSHSILRTRSFFEKRWILNSVRFAVNFEDTVSLSKKGTCPVIVCASGPSLKSAIPAIKKKKTFFVIAVSSAINPLAENGIIPDLCISTDGGFWAKTHLKPLEKIASKNNFTKNPGAVVQGDAPTPDITPTTKKIILALAAEGNCGTKTIRNSTILPLAYPDGIESEILGATGIRTFPALRCGTVSGTTLDLAMKITTGDIYFLGLDLSLSNGFQHTQSNLLEISDSVLDNRLCSSEKRNCIHGFSNQKDSLKIYEDWFQSQRLEKRNVFRVIENPKNSLGKIKDISVSDFEKITSFGTPPKFTGNSKIEKKERMEAVRNFVSEKSRNEDWLYNCFPIDYLNYSHNCDENVKEGILEKITAENESLLEKINGLCKQSTGK